MINSNIYNYINILDKAADASWKRNELLANNIANADTPGYKRTDMQFEMYLLSELGNSAGSSVEKMIDNVDLDFLEPTVYTDMSSLSYRLDGNNVDIDMENMELASNQIKYNALIDRISHEFSMLRAAMNTSS